MREGDGMSYDHDKFLHPSSKRWRAVVNRMDYALPSIATRPEARLRCLRVVYASQNWMRFKPIPIARLWQKKSLRIAGVRGMPLKRRWICWRPMGSVSPIISDSKTPATRLHQIFCRCRAPCAIKMRAPEQRA